MNNQIVLEWIEETCAAYCIPKPLAIVETLHATPTQGADARPVAIIEREQFEAHWCRDVPAMYRVAALAEIRACRDEARYKRDEIQWAWEAWQARATRDAEANDGPEFRESVTQLVDDMLTAWIADLPISACGDISARVCPTCKGDAIVPTPSVLTDEQIREIFMTHGFTIKEGQSDLKPYVYEAAHALLAASMGGDRK